MLYFSFSVPSPIRLSHQYLPVFYFGGHSYNLDCHRSHRLLKFLAKQLTSRRTLHHHYFEMAACSFTFSLAAEFIFKAMAPLIAVAYPVS